MQSLQIGSVVRGELRVVILAGLWKRLASTNNGSIRTMFTVCLNAWVPTLEEFQQYQTNIDLMPKVSLIGCDDLGVNNECKKSQQLWSMQNLLFTLHWHTSDLGLSLTISWGLAHSSALACQPPATVNNGSLKAIMKLILRSPCVIYLYLVMKGTLHIITRYKKP